MSESEIIGYRKDLPKYKEIRCVVRYLEENQISLLHKCLDVKSLVEYCYNHDTPNLYYYILDNWDKFNDEYSSQFNTDLFDPEFIKRWLSSNSSVTSLYIYFSSVMCMNDNEIDDIVFYSVESQQRILEVSLENQNKDLVLSVVVNLLHET